ncbi:MAG: DUF92 domain-containing protein [Nitrososphaerota archaeon]|nr:DUF92 domain-containing protein [Candidatus Calditenuaceae archaeon]MDW8072847.1 DUF92 domain-containing protein [Nitrososphaerota archaeon]
MNFIQAIEIVTVLTILMIISYRLRILDAQGTILAAAIGGTVYLTVGRIGVVLITAFVVVAGLFTKTGYDRKSMIGAAEPRKGLRGWRNVMGNGIVAAAAAIMYALFPEYSEAIFGGYVGAIAAVFADTMATEVGLLHKGDPRLIIGFKKVSPGTPGGVTLLGYGGALGAALILTVTWLLLGEPNPLNPVLAVLVVSSSALVGTSVDSVIGQYFQGVYRCETCGKHTELETHCGRPAKPIRGFRIVNNHVVNILCSLSGALVGAALTLLFHSTA